MTPVTLSVLQNQENCEAGHQLKRTKIEQSSRYLCLGCERFGYKSGAAVRHSANGSIKLLGVHVLPRLLLVRY
jgi:hypothetical protein